MAYQRATAKGYNKRVRMHHFSVGDLVFKKRLINMGVFEPKWVRPFNINDVVAAGSYKFEDLTRRVLLRMHNTLRNIISKSKSISVI